MNFQEKLANYARLIVVHGMNVQAGQLVNIKGEVVHRALIRAVGEQSYAAGAKHVQIDYLEPQLESIRYRVSSVEDLKYVPPHVRARYDEILDQLGATVSIVGPEEPDLFSDLEPSRINTNRIAGYQAVKRFYEEGIGSSRVQWNVAAGATTGWAKKVFPELSDEQALKELWDVIFAICRVDQPDFLERVQIQNKLLQKRAKSLTELGVQTLHFKGPGTDLYVGLSKSAIFKGGSDLSPSGVSFEPNIPTEECFTTPDYRLTEGAVAATRPVYINGKLIEGLKMTFKAGAIVDFSANSGAATFEEYISSDDGARRLGEVALVGIDSPVYQSGLVFQEILFDENAACHIAIGSAYKFCLKGGEHLEAEELEAIGCNVSCVHCDIMISSEEVSVGAVTFDGVEHPLLVNGRWESKWM